MLKTRFQLQFAKTKARLDGSWHENHRRETLQQIETSKIIFQWPNKSQGFKNGCYILSIPWSFEHLWMHNKTRSSNELSRTSSPRWAQTSSVVPETMTFTACKHLLTSHAKKLFKLLETSKRNAQTENSSSISISETGTVNKQRNSLPVHQDAQDWTNDSTTLTTMTIVVHNAVPYDHNIVCERIFLPSYP